MNASLPFYTLIDWNPPCTISSSTRSLALLPALASAIPAGLGNAMLAPSDLPVSIYNSHSIARKPSINDTLYSIHVLLAGGYHENPDKTYPV